MLAGGKWCLSFFAWVPFRVRRRHFNGDILCPFHPRVFDYVDSFPIPRRVFLATTRRTRHCDNRWLQDMSPPQPISGDDVFVICESVHLSDFASQIAPSSSDDGDDGNSTGWIIAGSVIGGLILIGVVVIVIVLIHKKRVKGRSQTMRRGRNWLTLMRYWWKEKEENKKHVCNHFVFSFLFLLFSTFHGWKN